MSSRVIRIVIFGPASNTPNANKSIEESFPATQTATTRIRPPSSPSEHFCQLLRPEYDVSAAGVSPHARKAGETSAITIPVSSFPRGVPVARVVGFVRSFVLLLVLDFLFYDEPPVGFRRKGSTNAQRKSQRTFGKTSNRRLVVLRNLLIAALS